MPLLVIKNSIGKYLFYGVISLLFVAIGIFILSIENDLKSIVISWSCVIFFGFAFLIFLWQIFDTRPRVVIDQIGVYDRTLGVGIIEWEDIEHAYLNSLMKNDFISLVLKNPEKYLHKLSKPKAKLAKYNRTLGFETININLSGVNIDSREVFDIFIKQLTKVRIKNLNDLLSSESFFQIEKNKSIPHRSE